MTMAVLCMHLDKKTLDSKLSHIVTIINEVTLVFLTHVLVCFAIFVLEGKV